MAQSLLREAHRQGHNLARTGVLEHLDERGWTPLLVAAAKGYHDVAELVRGGLVMVAQGRRWSPACMRQRVCAVDPVCMRGSSRMHVNSLGARVVTRCCLGPPLEARHACGSVRMQWSWCA